MISETSWMMGACLLSLNGPVKEAQFLALCDNLDPNTGGNLTVRTKSKREVVNADQSVSEVANRRVFYDFTVSPPKSVSLLALAGGDERLVQAHDEAVRVAMRELETFAATQVWNGGRKAPRLTGNLVTGVFRHDTSRALDLHLHSHCIVFNATFDPLENRWKALENREMYAARKYAENVYYHELSRTLRALGYRIRNKARGDFVVEGAPESLARTFSKRHEQIDEQTRALLESKPELAGKNLAAVRENVAHRRRSPKAPHVALDALRRDWRRQMSEDEAETLQQLKDGANGENPVPSAMDEEAALRWAEEHIFARKSLVEEHELWRFALERGRGESFTLEALHAATARAGYIRDEDKDRKLTTFPVLLREYEFVSMASEGKKACPPLVPEWEGDAALDAGQLAAARQMLASEDFVILFRGGAGTGKSFTLRTVHDTLKAHGHAVEVLAPQRQQVAGLAEDGMDGAQTISAFLTRQRMKPGAVVIVDDGHLTVCKMQEMKLSKGDRLQLKANAQTAQGTRFINGELVTVKRVEKNGKIHLDDGRVLPSEYREFVRGYAVTSYASQGKTVDHVLFSDSSIKAATNAEQWYVTISRGRLGVRIFTTDKARLRENVTRSGQERLAVEVAAKPAPTVRMGHRVLPCNHHDVIRRNRKGHETAQKWRLRHRELQNQNQNHDPVRTIQTVE